MNLREILCETINLIYMVILDQRHEIPKNLQIQLSSYILTFLILISNYISTRPSHLEV